MKNGSSNEPPRWDEGDSLWRLLGEAPRADAPAWFAAQALARCRREARDPRGIAAIRAQLAKAWRWALAGGVAVSMVAAMAMPHLHSDAQPDDQKSVQEAFAVVAALDSADPDSSTPSWQDSTL